MKYTVEISVEELEQVMQMAMRMSEMFPTFSEPEEEEYLESVKVFTEDYGSIEGIFASVTYKGDMKEFESHIEGIQFARSLADLHKCPLIIDGEVQEKEE